MKVIAALFFLTIKLATSPLYAQETTLQNKNDKDYLQASIDLIRAQQRGESSDVYAEIIESSTQAELEEQLDNDDKKLAFWINVYNGYIQRILSVNPELYEDRRSFYKKEFIPVAGRVMTFADIEHGIIRRNQFEYFLGYLRNPFGKKFKKKLQPKEEDFRIHFALNCGAMSCPPVRAYTAENLEDQLEDSTQKFLHKFSSYDEENKSVNTTALFSWFRGDFKGKRGTKRILERYGVIPHTDVKLNYDKYDWTLHLNNYVEG